MTTTNIPATRRAQRELAAGNQAPTTPPAKETKRRRRLFAPPPPPPPREEGLTPYNARGTRLRTKPGWARRGYYAPLPQGAPSTTRQAEVLNTGVVAAPTDVEALIVGLDCLSSSRVHHDPFVAYQKGIVSSPNVVVVGDVGSGKSSVCKSAYALRPLLLRDRRAVIFDKKDRGGEGEYAELVRFFGGEPLTFSTDGDGVVLNLLDPIITGAGAKNQVRLLQVAAELAQDGEPLDEWEREALRSAYRLTMRQAEVDGRVPVLPDVLANLGHIEADHDGGYGDASAAAKERLHEAALGVRFLMGGLLEEYGGIFDGPTSKGVRLEEKLTSFDISQLPDDGPAVPTVMAIANLWLLGSLRRNRGKMTNLVVEEGWHLVAGPNAGLLRSNTKLARALGLALVVAIHKLADIPVTSPAMAVLQEAQTVHVYRQSRAADVERCVRDFNLTADAAEVIPSLQTGFHLFKRGTAPEVMVRHVRSELEERLTETDAAMGGRR
ncbi:hypothetical protein ATJ97_0096 [Georgenia soli]|uniref:Uncharacterized protein n=1 Tax=Georgenia soli TaxID=638953 RepID=A0A2A9F216_9MICO|nr:ATP/GTP-binding protein [Georgenia soli]PFG45043.1 hypothetical protein ATJ97_0096 [Georgenia soli]